LKKESDSVHRVALKKKIRGDIKKYYTSKKLGPMLLKPITENVE
jgi:hypothetical protein